MQNIHWEIKKFSELDSSELYALLKARVDVFVVEQNSPYPDLDYKDQFAIHIWCEDNNEIMAYCRVFPENIKYNEASIGRVLTTKKHRGKQLGKQLVEKAISVIENEYKTSEIRISAQDYLLEFYSEFGFVATSKKYLEDGLPHTEMIRK